MCLGVFFYYEKSQINTKTEQHVNFHARTTQVLVTQLWPILFHRCLPLSSLPPTYVFETNPRQLTKVRLFNVRGF